MINTQFPNIKDKAKISPFVGYEFNEEPYIFNQTAKISPYDNPKYEPYIFQKTAIMTPKLDNPKYAYFMNSMRKNTHCQQNPEVFEDAKKGKFEMGKDNTRCFYNEKTWTTIRNPKHIQLENDHYKAIPTSKYESLENDMRAKTDRQCKTTRDVANNGCYEMEYKPTMRFRRPDPGLVDAPQTVRVNKVNFANDEGRRKFMEQRSSSTCVAQKRGRKTLMPRDQSVDNANKIDNVLARSLLILANHSVGKHSTNVQQERLPERDREYMKTEPNEKKYRSQSNPKPRTKEINHEHEVPQTARNDYQYRSSSNPKFMATSRIMDREALKTEPNEYVPKASVSKKGFNKFMRSMEQKQFDTMLEEDKKPARKPFFINPNKTQILDKFKKDNQNATPHPSYKKMKQSTSCNWLDWRNFNQRVNLDILPEPKIESRNWDVNKNEVIKFLKENKKKVYGNKDLMSKIVRLKGISNFTHKYPEQIVHKATPMKEMIHDYHTKAGAQGYTRNYENCGHPYYYV